MPTCKTSWGSDESRWTVGLSDDVGTGSLQINLYPFSPCSREIAEGVVAPGLKRSLRLLHSRERANFADANLTPLSDVWCFSYADYPDLTFSSGSSRREEFRNVADAFADWREQNVCTPGVHLLVLEGHGFGTAEPVDAASGQPSVFAGPKHAVVGTRGSLDRVVNTAVQQTVRTAIDARSVDAVRSTIDPGAAGDPERAEHQLGTLHGGAVSPMATLFEGSNVGSAYLPSRKRGRHAAHGACANGTDWNGTYSTFLSDCTVKAVLRTRNAATGGA